MNRFKFRAWNITDKIMHYNVDVPYIIGPFVNEKWSNPMQCTGLCDSEGKLIWEGDFVKHGEHESAYSPVVWDDAGFKIKHWRHGILDIPKEDTIKVISNIHEGLKNKPT